jgi:muramoyltetrapeptide carboxypeptidase
MGSKQIIDVIAPARADFTMTSVQIRNVVEKFDFEARFPDNMVNKGADLLCCNTIDKRSQYLVEALANRTSQIVWALAGGYGTTQLLPALDEVELSNTKKIIIGFSDITALSLYLMQKYDWPCIHARGIRGVIEGKLQEKEETILSGLLKTKVAKFEYELLPFNKSAREQKFITAKCTGGNLAIIQCSLGTNWHIQAENKILFLEDIDEPGYKVDRMLVHLDQAGVFDHVKAVILGDFECGQENELVNKVLKRFFDDKSFPVCKSEKFGHGKDNYPLPLGINAELTLGKDCKLSFNNQLV